MSWPISEILRAAHEFYNVNDYHDWVAVGQMLKSSDYSVRDWCSWSSKSGKHDPCSCDQKWESFRSPPAGSGDATVGTIVHRAVRQGFRPATPEFRPAVSATPPPARPRAPTIRLAPVEVPVASTGSRSRPSSVEGGVLSQPDDNIGVPANFRASEEYVPIGPECGDICPNRLGFRHHCPRHRGARIEDRIPNALWSTA